MASLDQVESDVNSLPTDQRPAFRRIFTEILTQLRFGHPKGMQPDPALNFGGGFFHGTTAASAGDEFTIAHGFGRVPSLAIPILLLDTVGSSTVPLTVSRAADDKRLYFTSTETGVPVSVYVE